MKVLLITNDFPPMSGGEAAYYARVCATLATDRVIVLAPNLPGSRSFDARQPYRIVRRWAPINPHPLARLLQIAIFLAYALGIARSQRVDGVHIGHLYLGPIGLALKRIFHIPYVVYLHGGEIAPYLRWRLVRKVAKTIVRDARLIVVNSIYTRELYQSLGMFNAHVEILRMSAATDRFRPDLDTRRVRARYGLDGHKVILTVGRLVERKGHDVVIRALSRVRQSVGQVRYLITGSGPEERKLRALARDLGVEENVQFIGHVPNDDLPFLYASCDVFVMPSRALARRDGVEGFGVVFMEAGACAKPVVGGRSGGIADAVLDGVTGILVDPADAEEVARTLTRLLLNPDEAGRLGVQGRQRARALEEAWAVTLARIFGGGPAK